MYTIDISETMLIKTNFATNSVEFYYNIFKDGGYIFEIKKGANGQATQTCPGPKH